MIPWMLRSLLTVICMTELVLTSCASMDSVTLSKVPGKEVEQMLEAFCKKDAINQFGIAIGKCESLIFDSENLSSYCADNIFILQEENRKHFAVIFRTLSPRRGQVGFNSSKGIRLHTSRPDFIVDVVTRGDVSKVLDEPELYQKVANGIMNSGLPAAGYCNRSDDVVYCQATLKNLKSAKATFRVSRFYEKNCLAKPR